MSFCLVDIFDMESPTKEIEDFENNSLKYLQPEQIEKIWLRLRGLTTVSTERSFVRSQSCRHISSAIKPG
ncbi:calcium/calmodulin-dependent 3',5'-cyclic nucleotide phosphodiesterase 1A-like isoform X1 [Tachysurus ichikawai]